VTDAPVPDLTPEAIAQAASEPLKASADGQSAEAVPIKDQIEAAKFLAANKKTAGGKRPKIRLTRIVPPGSA
jgi:hypothetical protein